MATIKKKKLIIPGDYKSMDQPGLSYISVGDIKRYSLKITWEILFVK